MCILAAVRETPFPAVVPPPKSPPLATAPKLLSKALHPRPLKDSHVTTFAHCNIGAPSQGMVDEIPRVWPPRLRLTGPPPRLVSVSYAMIFVETLRAAITSHAAVGRRLPPPSIYAANNRRCGESACLFAVCVILCCAAVKRPSLMYMESFEINGDGRRAVQNETAPRR